MDSHSAKKDKRDEIFVAAEVRPANLGIASILFLPCKTRREYFYRVLETEGSTARQTLCEFLGFHKYRALANPPSIVHVSGVTGLPRARVLRHSPALGARAPSLDPDKVIARLSRTCSEPACPTATTQMTAPMPMAMPRDGERAAHLVTEERTERFANNDLEPQGDGRGVVLPKNRSFPCLESLLQWLRQELLDTFHVRCHFITDLL